MGTQEPEADVEPAARSARANRALTFIAASVIAVVAAAIVYVHPTLSPGAGQASVAVPPDAAYQLSAVDFISPTEGWVVATFEAGRFAILHTQDAGGSWQRQLSGPTDRIGVYINFFDSNDGVFALIGPRSLVYRTSDGGSTWSSEPTLNVATYVLSAAFVDSDHGWLLVRTAAGASGPSDLFRTQDGGLTWSNLGPPVPGSDQALRVAFTNQDVGWLDTVSSRPYAYRSRDAGATWRQMPLPAPHGGWPAAGEFFVAAQPTQGAGVVATVAGFALTVGRSGVGERVLAYPPLTVQGYDGGVPVKYNYATFTDTIPTSDLRAVALRDGAWSSSQAQAPNQVQLGSLDGGATWSAIAPPSALGAIGYSDARNWWWIGSGAWSRSSDGGSTWTPLRSLAVPLPIAGSLQVLDLNHAWYGAMAGTRALLETTDDGGIDWRMLILPPVNPS
ncbi:MAG: hypothetical protein ABI334_08120 [Candidatus Dormiibacterota bacterium]